MGRYRQETEGDQGGQVIRMEGTRKIGDLQIYY